MKIYTKNGDRGETELVGKVQVSKADARVCVYGLLDDLNSKIGYARTLLSCEYKDAVEVLLEIQRDLFAIQSVAACEPNMRSKFSIDNVKEESVVRLENEIDRYQKTLPKLNQFILPGGGEPASAYLHICRTSARTVEREIIKLIDVTTMKDYFSNDSLAFINRLSDYLFVLARVVNLGNGGVDNCWCQ